MSEPLDGFFDCVFYQYHFVGGPKDGEISNGFRPYFRLVIPSSGFYHIYEVKNHEEEYVEWVNDGTRKIVLYYKGIDER